MRLSVENDLSALQDVTGSATSICKSLKTFGNKSKLHLFNMLMVCVV